MTQILFSMQGKNINTNDIRYFQKESLGRKNSDHCLLELSALPAKSLNKNHWKFYENHLNLSKEKYLEKRITCFKNLIKDYKPKTIIFYGITYKDKWESIIDKKLTDSYCKDIYYTTIDNKLCIVCKHPVARGISKDYFIKVGELVKNHIL